MLDYELDHANGILVVKPHGPLQAEDFKRLVADVDPFIEEKGGLNGLMIYTESLPGWESFAAFLSHMRFVSDHHRKIRRLAAVTDSGFLSIMPMVASHFVHAEIRHFDFDKREEAMDWLKSGSA